jgi:hypothetical protein
MLSNMPEPVITTTALAKHGVIALFGAVVHALNAHRLGKVKGVFEIAVLTVIASFSGVMFFLAAISIFGKDSYWTVLITGAGGFLGIEGLNTLVNAIKKGLIANMK